MGAFFVVPGPFYLIHLILCMPSPNTHHIFSIVLDDRLLLVFIVILSPYSSLRIALTLFLLPRTLNAEWNISASQSTRYKGLFHRLIDRQNKKAPSSLSGGDKGPLLKGSTAVTFFTQSGLSREVRRFVDVFLMQYIFTSDLFLPRCLQVLSAIWNLTDHDDVGSLHEGKFTGLIGCTRWLSFPSPVLHPNSSFGIITYTHT